MRNAWLRVACRDKSRLPCYQTYLNTVYESPSNQWLHLARPRRRDQAERRTRQNLRSTKPLLHLSSDCNPLAGTETFSRLVAGKIYWNPKDLVNGTDCDTDWNPQWSIAVKVWCPFQNKRSSERVTNWKIKMLVSGKRSTRIYLAVHRTTGVTIRSCLIGSSSDLPASSHCHGPGRWVTKIAIALSLVEVVFLTIDAMLFFSASSWK